MNKKQSTELIDFTQCYIDLWKKTYNQEPFSSELYDIESPCVVATKDLGVFWLPVLSNNHNLDIVEEVIDIKIHSDAHFFYGTQYAADMCAHFNHLNLKLVQVWSEEDFSRLEQNLIAHLTMQKKLKRRPSIFIATTDDETEIISIDNQTGAVILEKLIENKFDILSDSLNEFLLSLKPVAQ